MIRNPCVGQRVRLRYGKRYRSEWQDAEGVVVVVSRGPGPINVGVKTDGGCVVVPRGNLTEWTENKQMGLFS